VTVDALGLEVHFVKENVVISPASRSADKFMHGIRVLMAKQFVDNLSEEVKKGMTQKAETGMWPSAAPLGYKNVIEPGGQRVITPTPRPPRW
jgi:site-specific DNA recombinase